MPLPLFLYISVKCVGEQCTGTDQCRGDDVECAGSWPSTCRCPSDRYLDIGTGNCITSMFLGLFNFKMT